MIDTFLAALLLAAAQLSGLPIPDKVDLTVQQATPCQIQKTMAPKEPCKTSGLRIVALYQPTTNTVVVEHGLDLTTFKGQSTIIHEFVHYLQDVNDIRHPCQGLYERQAYDVELAFARLNGFADPHAAIGLHKLNYLALTKCRSSFPPG